MINYQRALPRDLFNESKLLEQIGRICLAIHDGRLTRLDFEHDGEAFDIQLSDDGELYIANLQFISDDTPIYFCTNYNSRNKNPLLVLDPETEENLFVFRDDGKFTSHFLKKFA